MRLLPRLVLAIGTAAGLAAAFVPGGGIAHAPSVHLPSPRSKAPAGRGADARAPPPPKPARTPLKATPAQDAADAPYGTGAPLPLFVSPRKASAVINEWMHDVARDKYSPHGGTPTAHLLQGTRNVLDQMNRTIGEGIPEHVFALTDSQGEEDIQAMATVTTHGSAASGQGGVVDVRELVARPTAGAGKHIAELFRGIRAWAAGRSITMSLSGNLADYYYDLGYRAGDMVATDKVATDMVSSGALLKEPPDSGSYRMTELVIDKEYLKAAKSQSLVDHRLESSNIQEEIDAMSTKSTRRWISMLGPAITPISGDEQSLDDI